jgi:small subunit ribosomal protein S16
VAVKIRLRRIGAKKKPLYRVIVAHSQSPRDGRFIETIGHYDPRANPAQIVVNEERIHHWLERGAQPTETVKSLLRRIGVWQKLTSV